VLSACGSTSAGGPASGGEGGNPTGGNATSGNATGGNATGGNATGGSGGASADDRLMPLEAGRAWSFTVAAIDAAQPFTACPDAESAVVGRASTPDGEGWLYDPACETQRFILLQNGDDIVAFSETLTTRIEYMKTPVEDGAGWASYRWQSVGAITVPAGTFQDCWRRILVDAAQEDYIEFCRGIGLVRLHSLVVNRELSLVSRNF
jgi:hypothetical protein